MADRNKLISSHSASDTDAEAMAHFMKSVIDGKHWHIALLEAIGSWASVEEEHHGRNFRYLIDGEAFDWLILAERLCGTADGLLPDDEKEALLLHGKPALVLSPDEVRQLMGDDKYRQYLNFFYGITVEEVLLLAVKEEVRKERQMLDASSEHEVANEAYRRIYGSTKVILLKRFRREKGYRPLRSITLTELKEFTYWLFKYRLRESEKAKVASDTRKALQLLNTCGLAERLGIKLE